MSITISLELVLQTLCSQYRLQRISAQQLLESCHDEVKQLIQKPFVGGNGVHQLTHDRNQLPPDWRPPDDFLQLVADLGVQPDCELDHTTRYTLAVAQALAEAVRQRLRSESLELVLLDARS